MFANRFIKWVFWILVFILILFGLLIGATKVLEQQVVQKAIEELNKEFKVPIYVDEVNFSLFKKFPYATMQFKNLTVLSAGNFRRGDFTDIKADTLLRIGDLYMTIKLSSLRQDKIELTRAYADEVLINLLVDKKGVSNYDVFNRVSESEESDSNNVQFLMEQVELKRAAICYNNRFKNISASVDIPYYKLKGAFYKEQYSVSTTGNLFLEEIHQGFLDFKPKAPANVKMNFEINNQQITLKQATLKTLGLEFQLTGTVKLGEKTGLDLKLAGDNIDLQKTNQWIQLESLQKYHLQGLLNFKAIIKGEVSEKISPQIAANYSVSKASLRNKETGATISGLSFTGKYSNGSLRTAASSKMELKGLNFTFGKSSFQGSLSVSNFVAPNIDLQSKVNIVVEDLMGFLPPNSGLKNTGTLVGAISSQGQINLDSLSTAIVFQRLNNTGTFALNNISYESTDGSFKFSNLIADVSLVNQNLQIRDLTAHVQNTTCSGNASIHNVFTIFTPNKEPLKVEADMQLGEVDYKDLDFLFITSDTTESNFEMDFDSRITARKYTQDSFVATNLNGLLSYSKSVVTVPGLTFQSMGGKSSLAVSYDFTHETISKLTASGWVGSVNMNQLFQNFSNFGQTFLTDKNIDGQLSSQFNLKMNYVKGVPDPSSLEYKGHVKIEDGRLQHFEPIKELAAFVDVAELEDIKFSTLENDLFIQNSRIQVPRMEINSSAFDITLSGEHQFSGDYEYHLQLYLSDLLFGKSKKAREQKSEFGIVADDGSNKSKLYLVVHNKGSDFKVSIDKDAVKTTLKSDVKEEKKELKKALKTEFGWFKNDSTLTKSDTTKVKKAEFTIEWDEE
jgi:hypothetical protein